MGTIVLEALNAFNLNSPRALLATTMSQAAYMTSFTSSATFSPGDPVYALVYIPNLQLSGWVEAVVVGEESMPGTIAVDGTPANVTFYQVRFGSNGLTDSVSPNHGAVAPKSDAAKAAITAGKGVWVKGI